MGYEYEFESVLDSKYECPICLLCQTDPVQTACGHRFCRSCIRKWIRERQYCPEDNLGLSESELFQDNCARREILQLRVKCPFREAGCTEVKELGLMFDHEEVCEHKMLACPLGCGEVLSEGLLDPHMDTLCPHRAVRCKGCKIQLPQHHMKQHVMSCGMMDVECEHHCRAVLKRKDMSLHMKTECPNVVVACSFAGYGCDISPLRSELPAHFANDTAYHLQLMCDSYKNLHDKIYYLSQKLEQSTIASYKKDAISPINNSSARPERTLAIESKFKESQAIEREMSDAAGEKHEYGGENASTSNAEFDLGQLDLSKDMPEKALLKVQDIIQNLARRTVTLEQKQYEVDIKVHSLCDKVNDIMNSSKTASVEQQQKEMEAKLHNLHKVISDMENRFCNGTLLWKIEKFWEFVLSHSENTIIEGPGFYTSSYGYRFCVIVGLCCNETAEKHISINFHLMKGDYDDYLDWPFKGRMTISILDQNENEKKRNHITETIYANPGPSCFDKPEAGRNTVGYGFSEFCDISQLKSGTYVKEEALVLKLTVEENWEPCRCQKETFTC